MLRRCLAACALALLGAVAGCDEPASEAGAQASTHTAGELGEPGAPWLWANDTLEELAASQTFPLVHLPLAHPMTTRLQFWVTAIDRAVREQLPGRLDGIPSPSVLVLFSRELGAEAHRVDVAFDVPARAAAAPPERIAEEGSTLELRPNGVVFGSSARAPAPLLRPAGVTTVRDFLRYYDQVAPSCRLEGDERGIVFGAGCRVLGTPVASRVAFTATSRFLTITTGLLARVADEDKVVAILAHELGHYYRAHVSAPTDRLNYLYARGGGAGTRPAPDPRFERETAAARAIARSEPSPMTVEELDRLIAEQHLGLYTTEQEADEISAELLARIGTSPSVAIDAILATQKLVEERSGAAKGVPWVDCAALRERGFRDARGAEVTVPVGSIDDAHHSFCFRAWNLAREIEGHAYAVAGPKTPPGPAWQDLLAPYTSASP